MHGYVKNAVMLICGTAAAIGLLFAVSTLGSHTANALPAYAQATGKPCGFCHKSAGGGGPLT
jgi:hypothetical protein